MEMADQDQIEKDSFTELIMLLLLVLLVMAFVCLRIVVMQNRNSQRIRQMEVILSMYEAILTCMHREISMVIARLERLQQDIRADEQEIQLLRDRIAFLQTVNRQQDIKISKLYAKLHEIQSVPCSGHLVWKITDFFFKLNEARQGRTTSLRSPAFHTRGGYKVSARLYLNGNGTGQGTHLSIYFMIMKGEHDALMQWPFIRSVKFWLVNQNGGRQLIRTFQPHPTNPSFQRPTFNSNSQEGFPEFVSLSTVTDPMQGFVIDDTVFIKIEAG